MNINHRPDSRAQRLGRIAHLDGNIWRKRHCTCVDAERFSPAFCIWGWNVQEEVESARAEKSCIYLLRAIGSCQEKHAYMW